MNYKYLFLFVLLYLTTNDLFAQPGITTEEEVSIQSIFIEGNREKLLGNYEKAIEFYKQTLKKSPNNHAVNYELARVYDVQDEDENALKAIKAAVAGDPSNMWYQMFLADVYQKMDKNTEAAAVYKKLMGEYPNEEYHHFKHAFFLVRGKKINEAIKVYDQMEKKFGVTEEFIRRKHTLYVGMGDNKKAIKELQKLIIAFPDDLDNLHLLAGFHEQIGQAAEAKAVYQQILELDHQDAKAQLALAGGMKENDDVTYLNTLKPIFSRPEEAIDIKIKALFPYITKVAETREPALSAATIELANMLCEAHPNDAKAYSIKGDLLYHAGKPQEALRAYQKTTQLDESVFAVWEQMLYIHAEGGDYDALIKTADNAIDLFPNQAKAHYFYAIGQINKEKHSDAVMALRQAALMTRKNPALKLDILTKLGLEYIALGKLEAAKKELDKAAEVRTDSYLLYDAQGAYYIAKGDQKAAQEWMDKAMTNEGKNNPLVLEHYGDLQALKGKSANALKYWKMAEAKGGSSASLLKKIK